MSNQPSLLKQVQQTYQELHADAEDMLAARVELAQLEMRLMTGRATRMATLAGICLILAAAGFVMLIHLATEHLPPLFSLSQSATEGLVGGLFFVLGLAIAGLSIRRFVRKYRHFEQTAAELRNDLQSFNIWFQHLKSGE